MGIQEVKDFQDEIDKDVIVCENLINSPNSHTTSEYIDCIINYTGRYGRFDNDPNFVFNLNLKITSKSKESEYYITTIKQIKSKLMGMRFVAKSLLEQDSKLSISNNNISQSISNTDVKISIDIDEVIESISSLPGLSDSEFETIKETIDKIQKIIDSENSKRNKWSAIKEYLPSIIDKGLEVSSIVFKWIFKNFE